MNKGFISLTILAIIGAVAVLTAGGTYGAYKYIQVVEEKERIEVELEEKEQELEKAVEEVNESEIADVATTSEEVEEDVAEEDTDAPLLNEIPTSQAYTPPTPEPVAPQTTFTYTDVCLNIDGIQAFVPTGYTSTSNICTLLVEKEDVCFNIDGIQEKVPNNMLRDKKFGCMTEDDLDKAIEEANKPTAIEIETACRKALDFKTTPTETKVMYERNGTPVYAGWAPDTTKELLDYFYEYMNTGCKDSHGGECYYGHSPDYIVENVEKYIPILEDRLSDYEHYNEICGE